MDGVLNVNKASGPTSHDVVDDVRRIFGQKRVGHSGTLDPMASGVLVVCLGKGTRIVEYIMAAEKEYRARITLGVTTNTQDSTGEILEKRDASGVTQESLEEAAAAFLGEIDQVPPMVSAVKHHGQRLYKLARDGQTVERTPRRVTIHSIEVSDLVPDPDSKLQIPNSQSGVLLIRCSSGTYIRTLCADIGERLGCGAHMSALERTRVGRFAIEDAVTVDDLRHAQDEARLESLVMDIDSALAGMPAVTISEDAAVRFLHGINVLCPQMTRVDTIRVHSLSGELLGIAEIVEESGAHAIRPRKVLVPAPHSQLPPPGEVAT